MLSREKCREIAEQAYINLEPAKMPPSMQRIIDAIADAIHAAMVEDSCKPGPIIEYEDKRRARVRERAERLFMAGSNIRRAVSQARDFLDTFDAEYERQEGK